jgi:hypothetical protein
MVFGGECSAVTSETFSTVIRGALLCGRGEMRVMATHTRHGVACFFLAEALYEGFKLAVGTESGRTVSSQNVVPHEIVEEIARSKFASMVAGALDSDVPFKMTLHANGVSSVRRKL